MSCVEVIEDMAALAALAPEWRDLWARDEKASPFQSPAWLVPWRRAFAPGPLHVVALRRNGRLAALAPFYVEQAERARLLPIGISLSDNLDILAEDDEAAQAVCDALLRDAPCDRVEIENTPEHGRARGVRDPDGWRSHQKQNEVCPVLALGETWDAAIPARKRRQWRRAVRAAEARGGLRVVDARDRIPEFLDHLSRLHHARWETRDEDGVLADEAVQRFHRLAAPELAAAGLGRFYLLECAGRIAGAYYGLAAKRRACAYIGGFDPEFATESPGAILIAHAMREANAQGAERFDFLRGGEAYKYAWGAQDEAVYRRIWERDT